MVYFDTSFLTPLFLEEPTSASVEAFISSLAVDTLSISHWTRVEFASLLAREVRMGGLSERVAQDANADFEATTRRSFTIFAPTVADFDRAKILLGHARTGLRAGDALHLAVASRPEINVMFTLDKTLLRAGVLLQLNVSAGSLVGGDG